MPYPVPPPEPPQASEVTFVADEVNAASPADEQAFSENYTAIPSETRDYAIKVATLPPQPEGPEPAPQFSPAESSSALPLEWDSDSAASLGSPLAVGWFEANPNAQTAAETITEVSQAASSATPHTPPATTTAEPETRSPTSSDNEELTVPEPSNSTPASPTPSPDTASPTPDTWGNGAVTGEGQLLRPTPSAAQEGVPLNLVANQQSFDPVLQTITAAGDVRLRVGAGLLNADKVWINLANRYVLAEGNVAFQQDEQLIRGNRAEYNLLQGSGVIYDARGELVLPTIEEDLSEATSTRPFQNPNRPISDRIQAEGTLGQVRSPGELVLGTSVSAGDTTGFPTTVDAPAVGGQIRRVRFEATRVDFDAEGWTAQELRLTNDPFSPPELELRSDSAQFVRVDPQTDELLLEDPRLVFDQSFSVPLFRERFRFRRQQEETTPFPVDIGIDGRDRDGVFFERSFTVARLGAWRVDLTPQFLVQRFIQEGTDFTDPSVYGAIADLTGSLSPSTTVKATANLSGFDLEDNIDERLRASVRVEQEIARHNLNFEFSYRDRLFNGSLGFQDVRRSLGAVLVSPTFQLGDSQITLSYQASAQYITAETDRLDLLADSDLDDELVSLGRFQGSIFLGRTFNLWQGNPLPATRDEGLRFSRVPIVPYLQLFVGGNGTFSYYTSEDSQESLNGIIGIRGQLGHFAEDFLDYTQFNLTYQASLIGEGESPFRFDRDVDRNQLSGGIIQQIYGPIRIGFQTAINLDTGEFFSTDYILEYSRRTYSIAIRFNPDQSIGFIGFRLSDFDWSGRSTSFGGAEIRQVNSGVIQQ